MADNEIDILVRIQNEDDLKQLDAGIIKLKQDIVELRAQGLPADQFLKQARPMAASLKQLTQEAARLKKELGGVAGGGTGLAGGGRGLLFLSQAVEDAQYGRFRGRAA